MRKAFALERQTRTIVGVATTKTPMPYRDANYGYSGYYVDRSDYNHYFREGFRRGYQVLNFQPLR